MSKSEQSCIQWFGRSPNVFTTLGARVERTPSGWMLVWHDGEREHARGPFRGGLEAAMDSWTDIRKQSARADKT